MNEDCKCEGLVPLRLTKLQIPPRASRLAYANLNACRDDKEKVEDKVAGGSRLREYVFHLAENGAALRFVFDLRDGLQLL